jgi:hypothetical protein
MQARFVSLRVTETWQMVERRSVHTTPSPSATRGAPEVALGPQPRRPTSSTPPPPREAADA